MFRRIADWGSAHPEGWALGMAGAAWAVVFGHAAPSEHAHHHADPSWLTEWWGWMVMVVAMNVPLHVDSIRAVAFGAPRRRHLAIARFLAGYLAPWAAAGVPVAWLCTFGPPRAPGVLAVVLIVALFWLLLPRRVPLPGSSGGLPVGVRCLSSCGPLMLACALFGHALWLMLGATALGFAQRHLTRLRVRRAES